MGTSHMASFSIFPDPLVFVLLLVLAGVCGAIGSDLWTFIKRLAKRLYNN